MSEHACELTQYGFDWGPLSVTRISEVDGYVVVGLKTAANKAVTVYCSPTGRSLRVFSGGKEMKLT